MVQVNQDSKPIFHLQILLWQIHVYMGGRSLFPSIITSFNKPKRHAEPLFFTQTLNLFSETEDYQKLRILLCNFHRVARQLQRRYSNRSTLKILDEYDVQDLLHSLLKIYFGDIRVEEWTPSYAGKSSRMDFILKDLGIIIEVKKTRKGLGDKELGDQLIIDKERYKDYPNCNLLIYFIYDPDCRISNPGGLIKDLTSNSDNIKVEVIINPVS